MELTRRRLLGGGLALTATGLLAACGQGTNGSEASGGGWSFTDDTGRKVELDARPERIAGLNDVVASLWNYGLPPVASFGYTALEDDVNFEGRELAAVKQVGRAYGEIDIEALAAQRPDLIVANAYPADSSGTLDPKKPLYGFKDLDQQQTVAEIAPIVAIAMRGSAHEVVARTTELARAAGADESALDAHRQDYEHARERLRKAAKADLSVMAVAGYPSEGVHIAKAKDDPALRSYTELGVTYHDPGGDEYYWQQVSWENVGEHRTDVVLYSLRAMSGDDLLGQPTFAELPAAGARQLYPWEFSSMDYVAQARTLDRLAANLEKSRKVT